MWRALGALVGPALTEHSGLTADERTRAEQGALHSAAPKRNHGHPALMPSAPNMAHTSAAPKRNNGHPALIPGTPHMAHALAAPNATNDRPARLPGAPAGTPPGQGAPTCPGTGADSAVRPRP